MSSSRPDLFGAPPAGAAPPAPLAERVRPRTLDEFEGQTSLLGDGSPLREAIRSDSPYNMILWGPPGTGKTTLARILAESTRSHFESYSAVTSGIAEIRGVVRAAAARLETTGRRTLLFVDEIHRFNKAQQDAFLPWIEKGTLVLVGATTENPSFEVNAALLSRSRVHVLERLPEEAIVSILARALADRERGLGAMNLTAGEGALEHLARMAEGDARRALNALELAAGLAGPGAGLTREVAGRALEQKSLLYDKSGEEHYNLISALHKSLRGSDPDAALYWMTRMLESGEDPLYVARRMIRFASEDIGLADPNALTVALRAREAYHLLGSPEGEIALAQACLYLAVAPKSNAVYEAAKAAVRAIEERPALPVPAHIRNAPTRLMRDLGYGKGYEYSHDFEGHLSGQSYLPEALEGLHLYRPGSEGREADIRERMRKIAETKARLRQGALEAPTQGAETGPVSGGHPGETPPGPKTSKGE